MSRFSDQMIKVQDANRTRKIARDEYARATSQAQFDSIRKSAAANAKAYAAQRTFALA